MNDIVVSDRRPSYDGTQVEEVPTPKPAPKVQPMNDRVLLRRLADPNLSPLIPEHLRPKSNKGEVIAVGPGMVNRFGERVPIGVVPGDIVLFGKFQSEILDLDGDEYILVPAHDLRLKEVKE